MFKSRDAIPSNQVAYPIDNSHPPFVELENHVMICDVGPGGAASILWQFVLEKRQPFA